MSMCTMYMLAQPGLVDVQRLRKFNSLVIKSYDAVRVLQLPQQSHLVDVALRQLLVRGQVHTLYRILTRRAHF